MTRKADMTVSGGGVHVNPLAVGGGGVMACYWRMEKGEGRR